MRLRAVSPYILTIALLVPCSVARAQPRADGAAASAEQLFQEGRQLMQENRFKEACPKLAQSQALDPAAGTLLNLGECYEKAGQLATAFTTYKLAWQAASERKRPDWVSFAEERMRSLEPKLPRLRITGQKPPGTHVELDGRPLPEDLTGTLRVDPGDHRIVVVDRDREIAVHTVHATEGVTTDVSLDEPGTPKPVPPPATPPPRVVPPPSPASGGGVAPAVWILGASSLVSLAVGGIFLGVREGQVSSIVSDCGKDGTVLPPAKFASCSDRSVAVPTALSIAGFGLGAALGLTALIVHFTSNSGSKEPMAMCAPGVGGGSCTVRF